MRQSFKRGAATGRRHRSVSGSTLIPSLPPMMPLIPPPRRKSLHAKAASPHPRRVRDLWIQDDDRLSFGLTLPELPGVVGNVVYDIGEPCIPPCVWWFVEIGGMEPPTEHVGAIEAWNVSKAERAAKVAVEAIMLPMLSAQGKIALAKRLGHGRCGRPAER
jgi:hypothetical protein